MLWASSSGLFFDLLQEYKITLQCLQSFEPYMNIIAASFPKTRQIAKTCFIDWSEELMEDHGVLPRDFECDTQIKLQCNSNRKYCTAFWTGQLKKAVILYGVNCIPASQMLYCHRYIEVFIRCSEVKKQLWGGNFWTAG